MAIFQFGVALRNARLDAFEGALGPSPKLQIKSGPPPATCAAPDAGALLCEMSLPADFMSAAVDGSKNGSGSWAAVGMAAAGASGTLAGHFRFKNAAGTVTHCQGDITAPGGGGAMILDPQLVKTHMEVRVTGFTLLEP